MIAAAAWAPAFSPGASGANAFPAALAAPKVSGVTAAMNAALDWLRRHQSADGSWKSQSFTENCKKPCTNRDPKRYGDGRGFPDHDVGVTGLGVLAFAGAGYSHLAGSDPGAVSCVAKAVEYLRKVQAADGRYGSDKNEQWIYDHAIATKALATLLAKAPEDEELKKSVTSAVKFCLHAQNPGFGWKYGVRPGKSDTSVTVWMVSALASAGKCKLDIPETEFDRAFNDARTWIDRATSNVSWRTGYETTGDEGSRLLKAHQDPYPYSKAISSMTAAALYARLLGGQAKDAPSIEVGIANLMNYTPRWAEQKDKSYSTINFYYWYYGTAAMAEFGGKEWQKWKKELHVALVGNQRIKPGSDEHGSWDPMDEWGPAGGRVYATAVGAITLAMDGKD